LCYRGTTESHFRKGRLSTLALPKTAVLALAVSFLAAGLAGCGGPKTTIENSGTYTVGADIVAGTYAARDPRKYNDNPLGLRLDVAQGRRRDRYRERRHGQAGRWPGPRGRSLERGGVHHHSLRPLDLNLLTRPMQGRDRDRRRAEPGRPHLDAAPEVHGTDGRAPATGDSRDRRRRGSHLSNAVCDVGAERRAAAE